MMKKFNEFINEGANYQDIEQASDLLDQARKLVEDAKGIIGDDNIKSIYITQKFESILKSLFDLKEVSDELHWDVMFKLDDETLSRHSEKYD